MGHLEGAVLLLGYPWDAPVLPGGRSFKELMEAQPVPQASSGEYLTGHDKAGIRLAGIVPADLAPSTDGEPTGACLTLGVADEGRGRFERWWIGFQLADASGKASVTLWNATTKEEWRAWLEHGRASWRRLGVETPPQLRYVRASDP